jgi:hypothetical protein
MLSKKNKKSISKLFNWLDTYKPGLGFFFIGILMLSTEIRKESILDSTDVVEIHGTLNEYSFEKIPRHRNPLEQYYIWLEEYECTFQIKADFIPFFDKHQFIMDLWKGLPLEVSIPKSRLDNLKTKEKPICVMSIRTSKNEYLSLNQTIEKHGSNLGVYAGICFLIVGVLIFAIQKYYYRKKTEANKS